MSNGLGRGLSSLIPQKVNKVTTANGETVVNVSSESEKDRVLKIAIEKIKINPVQPRKRFSEQELNELKDSIKQYGIIQPLIVSKQNGEYELIAGERRLRASKSIGLKEVPVIVRDVDDQEKLEVALIENIQRENLNPIETALAYRKLMDEFNLSQEAMAGRVGKSRPSVANTLRLLSLPEEIQNAVMEEKITEGHAKLLVGIDDEAKQMNLFKKILQGGLSVNDTTEEARKLGGTKQARIKINYADKDKEFAFREFFGTKVEINRKGSGGQVVISFFSDDELESIVEKIKK